MQHAWSYRQDSVVLSSEYGHFAIIRCFQRLWNGVIKLSQGIEVMMLGSWQRFPRIERQMSGDSDIIFVMYVLVNTINSGDQFMKIEELNISHHIGKSPVIHIIIHLTHTNVWESIGKPCSCTQFIKTRTFYSKSHENPYQYYKSRENPYQVLQVTCAARLTMPTATNEWYIFRYSLVFWW